MRTAWALLGAAWAIGGCASNASPAAVDPCAALSFPAKPAAAQRALYVSASCSGDGSSATKPVSTIGAAMALATPGTAILVAAGTYAETVRIEQPSIWLLGADEGASGEAPPVVIATADPYAVAVKAAGHGAVIRGLHVKNPVGVGIWVAGAGTEAAPVRIEASRVDGATATPAQPYGYGLMSIGSSGLVVTNTEVRDSSGVGFLIGESSVVMTRSHVSGSGKGGVRAESCNAEKNQRGVVLEGNTIEDNREYGLALFSTTATVGGASASAANVIRRTTFGTVSGDGVIVAPLQGGSPRVEVLVAGNRVEGNARTGMLVSAVTASGPRGIVLERNLIGTNGSVGTEAARSANFGAGVWVQGAAGASTTNASDPGVVLRNNTLSGNSHVGIGLIGSSRGRVEANQVTSVASGTIRDDLTLATVTLGDGVSIQSKSVAAVEGNDVRACFRLGALFDDAGSGTTVRNNVIAASSEKGIVLQNMPRALIGEGGNTDGSGALGALEVPAGTYGTQKAALGGVVSVAGP